MTCFANSLNIKNFYLQKLRVGSITASIAHLLKTRIVKLDTQ
ncbi:hypothetical protein APA_3661 [Pseudanabaena sp. lw0831]|nr:hypothetical protein APA_3661 [Pseudanabaena sp. lw0831]